MCKSGCTSNLTKYLMQHRIDVKDCIVFDVLQSPSLYILSQPQQHHTDTFSNVSGDAPFSQTIMGKLTKGKNMDCHRVVTTYVVKGLYAFSLVKSFFYNVACLSKGVTAADFPMQYVNTAVTYM